MAIDNPFSALKDEMNSFLPSFSVDASQIQILHRPEEFYKTLTQQINSAQSRIFISTLYIGNTESELVSIGLSLFLVSSFEFLLSYSFFPPDIDTPQCSQPDPQTQGFYPNG